jgi:uncharacterized protein YukE
MTDTITVAPEQLDDAAQRLHTAAGTAEELRGGMPDLPDAGDFTGAAGQVLARLIDAAGQIAAGLGAAGDAVTAASQAYRGTDAAAREQLQTLWAN